MNEELTELGLQGAKIGAFFYQNIPLSKAHDLLEEAFVEAAKALEQKYERQGRSEDGADVAGSGASGNGSGGTG